MGWRNYAILRRITAAMLWNEAKQYAILLLLWKFLRAVHKLLRTIVVSLLFLYAAADFTELATGNMYFIAQCSLYSIFAYGISALLLLLVAPSSKILKSLQSYFIAKQGSKSKNRETPRASKQIRDKILRTVLLHYRLWLELPISSMIYLLELLLAILLGVLYFALIATTQLVI